MKFELLTLFPEYVDGILNESILGRARKKGIIEINCSNIRDYSADPHRKVDDTLCGGGKGMLLSCQPVFDCHKAALERNPGKKIRSIYMSPRGQPLTQKKAKELAGYDTLIILCGHYEGVDSRAVELTMDEEISIGDYVLTGGELPACILADCVARLLPNVLSDSECHENESFSAGLLEEDQYTRPVEFMGKRVPEVLTSGDHEKIRKWRYVSSLEKTRKNRPDLV